MCKTICFRLITKAFMSSRISVCLFASWVETVLLSAGFSLTRLCDRTPCPSRPTSNPGTLLPHSDPSAQKWRKKIGLRGFTPRQRPSAFLSLRGFRPRQRSSRLLLKRIQKRTSKPHELKREFRPRQRPMWPLTHKQLLTNTKTRQSHRSIPHLASGSNVPEPIETKWGFLSHVIADMQLHYSKE